MLVELNDEQRAALGKLGAEERKLAELFLEHLGESSTGKAHFQEGKPIGLDFGSLRVTTNSAGILEFLRKAHLEQNPEDTAAANVEWFSPRRDKADPNIVATHFVSFKTVGKRSDCLVVGHYCSDSSTPRGFRSLGISEHPIPSPRR